MPAPPPPPVAPSQADPRSLQRRCPPGAQSLPQVGTTISGIKRAPTFPTRFAHFLTGWAKKVFANKKAFLKQVLKSMNSKSGHGSKARNPPVNIPIPTKIGSKMGGAPTPKWDPINFDPQPYVHRQRDVALRFKYTFLHMFISKSICECYTWIIQSVCSFCLS